MLPAAAPKVRNAGLESYAVFERGPRELLLLFEGSAFRVSSENRDLSPGSEGNSWPPFVGDKSTEIPRGLANI